MVTALRIFLRADPLRVGAVLVALIAIALAANSRLMAAHEYEESTPACYVVGRTVVFNLAPSTCVVRVPNATRVDVVNATHQQIGYVYYEDDNDLAYIGAVKFANHAPGATAVVPFSVHEPGGAHLVHAISVTLVTENRKRPVTATFSVTIIAAEARSRWSTTTVEGMEVQIESASSAVSVLCYAAEEARVQARADPPSARCGGPFPKIGKYVVSLVKPYRSAIGSSVQNWAIIGQVEVPVTAVLGVDAVVVFHVKPIGPPLGGKRSSSLIYIIVILLGLASVGGLILWRLLLIRRRSVASRVTGLPEVEELRERSGWESRSELQRRVEEASRALESEQDPRAGVILCWRRLEALATDEARPSPTRTAIELANSINDHLSDAQDRSLSRLLALYEVARFSRNPVGFSMRDEAREALSELAAVVD